MTTDDLISMHKATEQVIADVAAMDGAVSTFTSIHMRIEMLRQSVTTLATVQRDLLKSAIEGIAP